MTAPHTYITTTIPYVNARPHIGFALEVVQADVLARFRRQQGDRVRFQAGTDDNSLKNVLAAQAAGEGVREFVDRNAEAFLALGPALSLTVDDVIRTSRDARHRPGVERFWQACAAAGDLLPRRAAGRTLPRARHRAAARRRGELVLPAVPLRRGASCRDHQRRAAYRARRAP
jgi:methionyl-tRNA synthetase